MTAQLSDSATERQRNWATETGCEDARTRIVYIIRPAFASVITNSCTSTPGNTVPTVHTGGYPKISGNIANVAGQGVLVSYSSWINHLIS